MPGQNFRGFSEKVALVTNAADGVGRAVAMQLAFEGAFVVVHHSGDDPAHAEILQELQSFGTIAVVAAGDILNAEGVDAVFQKIADTYGRLDHLINCCAQAEMDLFSITDVDWRSGVTQLIDSAYMCCSRAIGLMKGRPSPVIVNILSDSEVSQSTSRTITASAISALTAAIAAEKSWRGRANSITFLPEVSSDDVARACVYLLSGESKAINGQTIRLTQ